MTDDLLHFTPLDLPLHVPDEGDDAVLDDDVERWVGLRSEPLEVSAPEDRTRDHPPQVVVPG